MPTARNIMRSVAVLVAALATAALVSGNAHAQTPQGQHCRMVIDRVQPGEQFSKVLSHTCADRPEDLHINAGTLLITWYQNAGYGGWSTSVEGAYGPCDREGYGIRDTGSTFDPFWPNWWRDNISSYKVWNNCYWADKYTGPNYGGDGPVSHFGNQDYVGDRVNDKVRSLTLHHFQ